MNAIKQVKITRYSWWIGGVIGFFIGLLIGKYDRLGGIIAGATNGIVFGWLIGWIIDRINQRSVILKNSQKLGNNRSVEKVDKDRDLNNNIGQKVIINRGMNINEVKIQKISEMNNANKSLKDEKVRNDIIILLLKSNEQAFNLLQENEKLPDYGIVEAFIYNVFLSKIFLKKINPELFNEIHQDYDLSMIESLKSWGLGSKLPNLVEFLNRRNSFFREEFETFQTDENYLASRLYNVFYENPLTNNPVPTTNFIRLMSFHLSLLAMMNAMKQAVEIIDNQYNLYITS